MNCYNHPDCAAVAVCKSCGRALCHECATDTGRVLACRERCETRVVDVERMVDHALKARRESKPQLASNVIFLFVCGGAMGGFGVWLYPKIPVVGVIMLIVGLAYVFRGVMALIHGSRLNSMD